MVRHASTNGHAPPQSDAQRRRLAAAYLAAEIEHTADAAAESALPNEGNTTSNNNNTVEPVPASATDMTRYDAVRLDACATDLATYCKPEANILILLENAPMGVEREQITHAMQNVQTCMAKNIEALSPACIESLVESIVNQKSSVRTSDEAAAVEPFPAINNNPRAGDDDDSSMEVSIHYTKHHNTGLRGHPVAAAAPVAIDQAKQASTLTSGGGSDMDIGSPLMWCLVFPFFCIGLYVSYNYVVVYLRRRRDALRVESKQYMPVP
uniref:Uncharacterized protein n=1 Tax=Globisporangium ultimum (strain ATCC 200006 / CBS 805.95 / DAOM BR144) TaxID=431595 RepID=K3WCB2_GLOUD